MKLLLAFGLFVAMAQDAATLTQLGVKYRNSKDVTQALAVWRQAAELGSADSEYYLGWTYWKGKGVTKDREQALVWLKRAATHGNKKAVELLEDISQRDAKQNDAAKTSLTLCPWTGGTPYCHS